MIEFIESRLNGIAFLNSTVNFFIVIFTLNFGWVLERKLYKKEEGLGIKLILLACLLILMFYIRFSINNNDKDDEKIIVEKLDEFVNEITELSSDQSEISDEIILIPNFRLTNSYNPDAKASIMKGELIYYKGPNIDILDHKLKFDEDDGWPMIALYDLFSIYDIDKRTVDYNSNTKSYKFTVDFEDGKKIRTIEMTVDSMIFVTSNGTMIADNAPVEDVDGNVYMHVSLLESFGSYISWDSEKGILVID